MCLSSINENVFLCCLIGLKCKKQVRVFGTQQSRPVPGASRSYARSPRGLRGSGTRPPSAPGQARRGWPGAGAPARARCAPSRGATRERTRREGLGGRPGLPPPGCTDPAHKEEKLTPPHASPAREPHARTPAPAGDPPSGSSPQRAARMRRRRRGPDALGAVTRAGGRPRRRRQRPAGRRAKTASAMLDAADSP